MEWVDQLWAHRQFSAPEPLNTGRRRSGDRRRYDSDVLRRGCWSVFAGTPLAVNSTKADSSAARPSPSCVRRRQGADDIDLASPACGPVRQRFDLLVIALIGALSAVNGYGLAVWLADGSVIVVIVTCGVVGLLVRPFRERLLPDRDEPGIERSG